MYHNMKHHTGQTDNCKKTDRQSKHHHESEGVNEVLEMKQTAPKSTEVFHRDLTREGLTYVA